MEKIGFTTTLTGDMASVQQRVTEALKVEGFGILTEIDIQSTLKNKIDIDFRPYKILGACNPRFAHRALTAAPEIGLLLPCNVTLSETAPNTIEVSLIDPWVMTQMIDHDDVKSLADEVRQSLQRAIDSLT
jgi:uncharacterized protein (DUF302 family)